VFSGCIADAHLRPLGIIHIIRSKSALRVGFCRVLAAPSLSKVSAKESALAVEKEMQQSREQFEWCVVGYIKMNRSPNPILSGSKTALQGNIPSPLSRHSLLAIFKAKEAKIEDETNINKLPG